MPLRTHDLAAVLAGAQTRCVIPSQPTHRHHPGYRQDPIRYRDPGDELERSLLEQSLEADVASFLEPFDAHEHDVEYWSKIIEGQEL